jgi:serine/threonine-protein kinase
MSLSPGKRLGPYEIQAAIGAGGMGEVYRARDTKLHRDVALKVLPDEFASDPDRLARFEREAHVLASLNHPHIASIYGFEDDGPTRALVLEFVPGDTLADRIVSRGPMPLDQALAIGRQIAEALQAAHEQGVVHRDLKPANVKVRDDGAVKVLDFGLAKAFDPGGGVSGVSQSPTLTSPAMTQAGVILGTAAYMSPEQARGQNADKRSDVWAFGCVLYEMLTGTAPFTGETVSDLVASVLRGEPDWSRLPHDLPSSIAAFLKRCLDKDRGRRVADASVALFVLGEGYSTAATDRPAPPTSSKAWGPRQLAALGAAALLGAAGAGALVWYSRPAPEAKRLTRLTITPPQSAPFRVTSGANLNVAIAPDGTRIVYPGQGGSLSLRRLDSLEATPLPGLGDPIDPFFSPDGQWIGFFNTNSTLEKVAVTGGPSTSLTSLRSAPGRGASWADDGTIVFATAATSGLLSVPSTGGEVTVLTTPNREAGEGDHVLPQMLPGGRGVLFTIMPATGGLDRAQAAVLDLKSKNYKIIVRGGSQPRYLPTGHLVYAAAGTLRAVPFNLDTLEPASSPPIPVLSLSSATTGTATFDVSSDGTLVYVTGQGEAPAFKLVWVDRQGHEESLAAPPRAYLYPRLSPDGKRIALDIRDHDNDIWMWDLQRETLTRVTVDPGLDRFPVWSRDGRRLIFSSDRTGQSNLFTQPASEIGKSERLLESATLDVPLSLSRDGRRLVFRRELDLMLMTLDERGAPAGPIQPLLNEPFQELTGEISPNDKWIAYGSDESGTFEIYVRPFPDVKAGRSQVSRGGGTQPVWSRDGRELFFFSPTGELMGVDVGAGPAWTATPPRRIVPVGYFRGNFAAASTYDISPDGKRFLMIKRVETTPESTPVTLVVVQNWFEELKRLAPTR